MTQSLVISTNFDGTPATISSSVPVNYQLDLVKRVTGKRLLVRKAVMTFGSNQTASMFLLSASVNNVSAHEAMVYENKSTKPASCVLSTTYPPAATYWYFETTAPYPLIELREAQEFRTLALTIAPSGTFGTFSANTLVNLTLWLEVE